MSQPVWDFDFFPTPVAAAGDPNTKDELRGKQPTKSDLLTGKGPFYRDEAFYLGEGIFGGSRLDLATPHAGYLHLMIVARSDCLA